MSEVKTNKISSLASNNNITLEPDGTGKVVVPAAIEATTSTHANASVFKSTGNTQIMLQDTDATANDQFWGLQVSGGDFNILTCNDDRASGFITPLTIDSNGTATFTEGDAITVIDRVGTNVAGIKTGSGDDFCVGTADYSQAIRIKNNSGHVGIGTVAPSNAQLCVENSANENVGFILNSNTSMTQNTLLVATARNTTDGTYNHFQCAINGVAAKLIVYDGGQVVNANNSYGQISDQRLKENIADASSQWDDIKALQVRNFNFIGDELTQIGVVAQEVETAGMNGLIQEAAWYNAASNPDSEVRKTVKYSVLYMKAVKALQEAMTRIETLETKVAALEAGE